MSKALDTIRVEINKALANCLRDATPYVCGLAETQDGYLQLENQIIRLMLNRSITPEEAIQIIETEYGGE